MTAGVIDGTLCKDHDGNDCVLELGKEDLKVDLSRRLITM